MLKKYDGNWLMKHNKGNLKALSEFNGDENIAISLEKVAMEYNEV